MMTEEGLEITEEKIREVVRLEFAKQKKQLNPAEAELVLRVTRRYNLVTSVVASLCAISAVGLLAWGQLNLARQTDSQVREEGLKAREKLGSQLKEIAQDAKGVLDSIKSRAETRAEAAIASMENDAEDAFAKMQNDAEDATSSARDEMRKCEEWAEESIKRLIDQRGDIVALQKELERERSRRTELVESLTDLVRDAEELRGTLREKEVAASGQIKAVNGILKSLRDKQALLDEKKWLLELLSKSSIELFRVSHFPMDGRIAEESYGIAELEQHCLSVGDAQVVWGTGMIQCGDGWATLRLAQRFADTDTLSIAFSQVGASESYPVIRRLSPSHCVFRIVRKRSSWRGYHKEEGRFTFIAIGKPEAAPETISTEVGPSVEKDVDPIRASGV